MTTAGPAIVPPPPAPPPPPGSPPPGLLPPGLVPPGPPGPGPRGGREPIFTNGGPLRGRTPVSRHRPRGRHRLRVALALVILPIVVVAASGFIAGADDDANHRFREFVVTAEVGQPVTARGFEATVLEVRTAAAVAESPDGGRDTGGVWVVVLVRAESLDEPTSIGYAAVADRQGRSWLETQRVDQPLVGYPLQPGIPVIGRVAFEVPDEVATELTLRLSDSNRQMTTVAEVPLPIDPAAVDAAAAEAVEPGEPDEPGEPEPEPVLIGDVQVVPPDLQPRGRP